MMEDKRMAVANIETNLAYIMAESVMLFVKEVEKYLASCGKVWHHEKKQAFTNALREIKALRYYEDMFFDRDVIEASKQWSDVDDLRADANDIARFVLLFVEKCGCSAENKASLERFMMQLPDSIGSITKEELDKFILR